MRPFVVSAAVAGLLALGSGECARAGRTNSKALAKPLQAAQESFKAKEEVPGHDREAAGAEGTPGKTPYDQHLINEMMSYSCVRTNDYACAAKTYEALLTDGFTTPAQVQSDVRALVIINSKP